MDPRQTPHVHRYFDPADRFVRIRVCDAAEAGIEARPELDRAAYRLAVVAACVEGFEEPEPELRSVCAGTDVDVDDALALLYQIVVSVNPALELRAVRLPGASAGPAPEPGTRAAASGVDDPERALRRRARGLEERLLGRVFGQDEAVGRAAAAVRRAASGLARGRGPLASLLLVGPTGTGKTELGRALAAELEGAGFGFVRVDCGELAQGTRPPSSSARRPATSASRRAGC